MTTREELVAALADVVSKSTSMGADGEGFVHAYALPTGPIHRAIALLAGEGVHVRPGGGDDVADL